jgi:hypothetical protein
MAAPMKYWATIHGQVRLDDGTVPDCPECGVTSGLTFIVIPDRSPETFAKCPNGHRWRDRRVPQDLVIFAATARG